LGGITRVRGARCLNDNAGLVAWSDQGLATTSKLLLRLVWCPSSCVVCSKVAKSALRNNEAKVKHTVSVIPVVDITKSISDCCNRISSNDVMFAICPASTTPASSIKVNIESSTRGVGDSDEENIGHGYLDTNEGKLLRRSIRISNEPATSSSNDWTSKLAIDTDRKTGTLVCSTKVRDLANYRAFFASTSVHAIISSNLALVRIACFNDNRSRAVTSSEFALVGL